MESEHRLEKEGIGTGTKPFRGPRELHWSSESPRAARRCATVRGEERHGRFGRHIWENAAMAHLCGPNLCGSCPQVVTGEDDKGALKWKASGFHAVQVSVYTASSQSQKSAHQWCAPRALCR
jgi:hypothetical protein